MQCAVYFIRLKVEVESFHLFVLAFRVVTAIFKKKKNIPTPKYKTGLSAIGPIWARWDSNPCHLAVRMLPLNQELEIYIKI